jgi:predicted nucleic acid-binding protein
VIQYEILIGANTNQEYHFLKNKLKLISILGIDKSDLSALIDFGLKVKKEGLQGKFTDVSIAYLANKYHCPIFTFDQYFHKLAKSKVISVFNQ